MNDHAETMNDSPEVQEEEPGMLDWVLDRFELRQEIEAQNPTQEELDVEQEKEAFREAFEDKVFDFLEVELIPLAKEQKWDELDEKFEEFLGQSKDLLKSAGIKSGKRREILGNVESLAKAYEEAIRKEIEPSLKRSLACEAFYCIPEIGPMAMFAESKLGWTLSGERLTERQRWWREQEAKIWMLVDLSGGGFLLRVAKGGGKAGVKAGVSGAKMAGKAVAREASEIGVKGAAEAASSGIFRRLFSRKAGSMMYKAKEVKKLKDQIKKSGSAIDGLLAYGKHARSTAEAFGDLAWSAGHKAADKGIDLVWGDVSAKKIRQARQEVESILEAA